MIEESTAAKESARVLAEALVFTRPEELDGKPIIKVGLGRVYAPCMCMCTCRVQRAGEGTMDDGIGS